MVLIDEDELCSTILNSFLDSWESFYRSISEREEHRTFNNLFDWFMEEETMLNSRKLRGPPPAQEEEKIALATKEKKGGNEKKFNRK